MYVRPKLTFVSFFMFFFLTFPLGECSKTKTAKNNAILSSDVSVITWSPPDGSPGFEF